MNANPGDQVVIAAGQYHVTSNLSLPKTPSGQ